MWFMSSHSPFCCVWQGVPLHLATAHLSARLWVRCACQGDGNGTVPSQHQEHPPDNWCRQKGFLRSSHRVQHQGALGRVCALDGAESRCASPFALGSFNVSVCKLCDEWRAGGVRRRPRVLQAATSECLKYSSCQDSVTTIPPVYQACTFLQSVSRLYHTLYSGKPYLVLF